MRTRRGVCCKEVNMCEKKRIVVKKRRNVAADDDVQTISRKRCKVSPASTVGGIDLFELLPDDLVLSILSKLSSTATCPSDFTNALITYVNIIYVSLSS